MPPKKKLLIFVDWFAPGYLGGGQIQSCVNLASALQHEMEISVVTTDRDLGSDSPYDSIRVDEWNDFENNIRVLYLSPGKLGYKSIKSIITALRPDIIYLNSMFSVRLTLLPLEVCRIENWKIKVVLAPRGMLHAGALQYKKLKKRVFFRAFKVRRFHKRIVFHATDKTEAADIRKVFGSQAKTVFVEDFPSSKQDELLVIPKEAGSLQCLFVSRITPKKNLFMLLSLLKSITENLRLTIVGPTEDLIYWEECKRLISLLPENIKVDFYGPKANYELAEIYRSNHLFILPTYGENFGHVIFESLVNGRPVLISDRTPWRELEEKHAGWDISLNDEQGFLRAIRSGCGWNQEVFNSYCRSSWSLASSFTDTVPLAKRYLELFQ